jgi:hypothetical protein
MHPNLISFVIAGLGMSHILKQIIIQFVLIAISFKQVILFNGKMVVLPYYSGSMVFSSEANQRLHGYEEIQYGIVSKIVKKSEKSSPEAFRIESKQVWTKLLHEYDVGLPDITRYGDETWERTIVREFFDHFVSRATHLLDLAVSQKENPKVETLRALVEACAWLEMAHRNDKLSSRSIGLWKNFGLQ